MSFKAGMDSDQVREIAKTFTDYVSEFETLVTNMGNSINSLSECWEGADAVKFQECYSDLEPSLTQTTELIASIADTLTLSANDFDDYVTNKAGSYTVS